MSIPICHKVLKQVKAVPFFTAETNQRRLLLSAVVLNYFLFYYIYCFFLLLCLEIRTEKIRDSFKGSYLLDLVFKIMKI